MGTMKDDDKNKAVTRYQGAELASKRLDLYYFCVFSVVYFFAYDVGVDGHHAAAYTYAEFPHESLPAAASELLKWVVLSSLLIGCLELVQKTSTPSRPRRCWTLLDAAFMVLTFGAATSACFKGFFLISQKQSLAPRCPAIIAEALASVSVVISFVFLAAISLHRLWRGLMASGFVCVVLGILFTTSAVDLLLLNEQVKHDEIVVSEFYVQEQIVIINVVLANVALGCFLFSGLRDTPVYNSTSKKFEKGASEDNRSTFGIMLGVSIFKYLSNAVADSKTTYEGLPSLNKRLQCSLMLDRLYSILTKTNASDKSSKKQSHLLRAIFRVVWLDTFWVITVTFSYYACLIARMPVLESLIDATNQTGQGTLILLFLATATAESMISCYMLYLSMRLGLRIRSMLQAAIFRKITRLSPTSRSDNPPGYVVAVMAMDCMQLSLSLMQFTDPIVGMTCMPIVFYLLATRVGTVPALCCAAWLLAAILLPFPTSRLQMAIWGRVLRFRDDRVKRLTDLFSSVRLVKMCAWEDAYMQAVKELRAKEMVPLFLANLLDGFIDSLYSASGSVMIIILFGTLAALDPTRTLSASISFSSVYILSITEIPTNSLSTVLRTRSLISLGMTRIIKLCTEEEHEEEPVEHKISRRRGEIVMEKCTFAWTKRKENLESPTLNSVSLDIAPGSLVGVAGFVGSGKSSLLSAILGDMHCIKGTIRTSGRISYVPQVACVYNMTVRDNILFGEKFDPVRYGRVLRACELLTDIEKFPAGDLTEVGEKGTTVSGGQKQRISLARAAYSRSDTCLLDDPLNALDSKVADRVFKQVVGNNGLLKNQTRIMVSNQGHILKNMEQLLLMHGKTVITYRTIDDLVEDDRAPETLRLATDMLESQMTVDGSLELPMSEQDESSGKVIRDEVATSFMRTTDVVWSLFKLSGVCIPIAIAFFVASAIAFAWQQLWIKQWTDADSSDSTLDPHDPSWIRGLVTLCFCDVLFRSSGGMLLAVSSRQLSLTMHQSMLKHVLYSPVSFFDSTPRGRLLNRFTLDLVSIDARLYLVQKQGIQNIMIALARLSIVSSQQPPVMAVGVIAAILVAFGMRILIQVSNTLRFRESTHVSKILQHTTETIDSLSTVRTYGAVERFCKHFFRLTDDNLKIHYGFLTSFRVTRVLTSLLGFIIVLATVIFSTLFHSEGGGVGEASSVGLALSSSLGIPMILTSLCVVIFSLFQIFVSFERCIEYTKLPEEEQVVMPEKKGDSSQPKQSFYESVALSANESWPTKGRVEFQNYSTSYRPGDLSEVLKGVTFSVEAHEKVGVVGRTGAGKSSLVLALLRVLKATQGCIKIDGIDISRVPLRRLRSAITVIPQDPILVRGSLRDNLDPTRSHTDEELWRALDQAHLGHVVSMHPEQLLFETGEGGSNLSVGQRQLVCLARALIRMPQVLILDEATSQMDGDTDRLIQATLRENFMRCTVLAIAHRIHTVLDYDKILVMSDGSVLEFGSVTQLLSNPASMFSSLAQSAGVVLNYSEANKR